MPTDPTVTTTLTRVAVMVGLPKATVRKIVESGLPVMADAADGDPGVFKAMYAQSRKPVPPPTPAYYTTLGHCALPTATPTKWDSAANCGT